MTTMATKSERASNTARILEEATRIGEVLRYLRILTRDQVTEVTEMASQNDTLFGCTAVQAGYLQRSDLDRALEIQAAWRKGGVTAIVAAWAALAEELAA